MKIRSNATSLNALRHSADNLKEVKSSIEKLKRLKFLIFVVTNQPDIGNKFVSRKIVNQMHFLLKKKMQLNFMEEILV